MKRNLLLIAICMASFLGCLDLTIVNTALPAIQKTTGASINLLQWVITGLLATLSSTMVLAGRLADLFGHRRLMISGLILFGIASLLAGAASNIHLLIGARVLQGAGIAILYTVPAAIITHLYEKEKVAKAMGYYFSASSIGIASGPLLGGFVTGILNWHWIFYLNIPVIIVSLIICILLLPKNNITKTGKIDILGATLLAITLISVLLVTSHLDSQHTVINYLLIGISAISFLCFIKQELRSNAPLLDLSLFRNKTFILGSLANIALACFYSVAFFLMPLYLNTARHFDALHIGLILLPATLTLAITSPFVNKLVEKYSVWAVLAAGFACLTISALLQQNFNTQTPLSLVIISYGLLGLGWSFILSPSFASALTTLPKEQSGVGMGTLGTLHNAGGSIGLAVGILLFTQKPGTLSATQFITHQHGPFLFIAIIAGIMFLGNFLYALTSRTKKSSIATQTHATTNEPHP